MTIQIVTVKCSRCPRWFRTSLTVAQAGELPNCPECGSQMRTSAPQPLSALSHLPLKQWEPSALAGD
jgi:DNA-directed RNA polymerase subunit RPC12/RpoP